jgi:hypothetical protein
MKSHFKDQTEIKKQHPKDKPKDFGKSPFDFTCPQYDQRSSCFVNAGTHYGVVHAQPVGTEKVTNKCHVPVGRVDTMTIRYKE